MGGAFLSTQNEAFMGGEECAKKDEISGLPDSFLVFMARLMACMN
jgi:hypothetical protein